MLQGNEIFFSYDNRDSSRQGLLRIYELGRDGKKDDGRADVHGPELTSCLEAVHPRHGEVQDDHVWPKKIRLSQRVQTVDGLATNLEAGLAFQEMTNSSPNNLTIVDDEDVFGQRPPLSEVAASCWRAPVYVRYRTK